MVVRLPGDQKVRGSSSTKGYLFLRSVGILSRCLVLVMSHNIRLLQLTSRGIPRRERVRCNALPTSLFLEFSDAHVY